MTKTAFLTIVTALLVGVPTFGSIEPTDERLAILYDLEDHCMETSDPPMLVSESCIQSLSEYFSKVPIWNITTLVIHQNGRPKLHRQTYSRRDNRLKYTQADLQINNAPTWSDIFDENVADRAAIVAEVLHDDICVALRKQGKIQNDLSERCRARELFKYATYLDACLTAFSRSTFLHATGAIGTMSRFEIALEEVDRSRVLHENEGNSWQLVEKYLHTLWTTSKCSHMPSVVVEERSETPTGHAASTYVEMKEAIRPIYEDTFGIAARAGDTWAIQSYYAKDLHVDIDYWKSLYAINPLLFHRWMATDAANAWLQDEEQIAHALHALSIEREVHSHLQDMEISEYLRLNGLYSLFKPLREVNLTDRDSNRELKFPWDGKPRGFEEIKTLLLQE